jgi:hypothetical protein
MTSKTCVQLRVNLQALLILTPFMLTSIVLTFTLILATTGPAAAGGLLQPPPSAGFSAISPPQPELPPSSTSPTPEQPAPTAPGPGTQAPAGGSSALIMWIVIGLIIGIGIVIGALALQQRPE